MTGLWTARRLGLGAVLVVAALCGLAPALGAQTVSPPSGVILGRVVEADTDRGVAGAVVRLSAGPLNAITNGSGYFLFRDVPSGTYALTVQAVGFLPASYGQRRPDGPPRSVQVDATRPPTNVTIRAWRPGAIEGTLRDELGDPLVGAAVRAMRREPHSTDAGFVAAVATSTDDRGLFCRRASTSCSRRPGRRRCRDRSPISWPTPTRALAPVSRETSRRFCGT